LFPDIISVPVKKFSQISGLSESTIWAMIHDGRLETIAVGRRRLILLDSYRQLIEQQRAAPPQDCRRNTAVPPLRGKRDELVSSSVSDPKTPGNRKRGGPRKISALLA
jgi:hypothetical protein